MSGNNNSNNVVPFTLHVRLTRFCNASCDYCSSWQESPDNKMSKESYEESLFYIYDVWQSIGLDVTDLTIEYVGGELLLLSKNELNNCVRMARDFFNERGVKVVDGAQSNLIGTSDRIKNIFDIFDGRVGTSIDNFSEKRKFKGSSSKYKTIFIHNESSIVGKRKRMTPAVFTVDRDTLPYVKRELELAMLDKRDLMIRPVFGGGSAVNLPNAGELADIYEECIRAWWMNSSIRLEPVYSLVRKRVNRKHGAFLYENFDYCSFQSNCASRSMGLEPNGDIFICQDMADANRLPIGNALNKVFNYPLWAQINNRSALLSTECYSCDYFKECQGGCLLKSLEDGNGLYGKSTHCYSWKRIFSTIDELILITGINTVIEWLESIEELNEKAL